VLRVLIFSIFAPLFARRLQRHHDLSGRNHRKAQRRFSPLPQVLFLQRKLHQRVQEKYARRHDQKNKNCHLTNPSTRLPVPLRTT
jgi:hypothetical protein